MTSARFCSAASPGLALLSLLVFAPLASSQNAAAPAKPALKSGKTLRSTAKSPNVKPGELVAIDATDSTIKIKDRMGKIVEYALTDKTQFTKNRREAEQTAFKPGDAVVVHIRKSRDGGDPTAAEVADKESWKWTDGIRHNTTEGTLTRVNDESLTVAIGADKIPQSYSLSDKTLWQKGGKEAAAADFKTGDKIYVLPRSLPSGAIMARAITDTSAAATQVKERQSTSLHGVIKSIDANAFKLTLETPTNDMRDLQGSAETEVVQKSRTVGWPALKVGQHVRVRLRHDDTDEMISSRITIETARSGKVASAQSGKSVKPATK
jgi:hypothetical protein